MNKCLLFIAVLIIGCGVQDDESPNSRLGTKQAMDRLGLQKDQENRVVLVGGALISQMEGYGYFESSVLRTFPNLDVTFRNIGWPADDVFGVARSQFGSAQNTRSWKPPTAEDGFGSKVLSQHINEAGPSTIIVGYGGQQAYEGQDMELFLSGYRRLLDNLDSINAKIVLLSPPRHEALLVDIEEVKKRNTRLAAVRDEIANLADEFDALFIDLFTHLVEEPQHSRYTHNGVHLNQKGYKKMCQIMCESLQMSVPDSFELVLDTSHISPIKSAENLSVQNIRKTIRGFSFDLSTAALTHLGRVTMPVPFAIYIDDQLMGRGDTSYWIGLERDSLKFKKFKEKIAHKNRLHRYRLRPMNEAYIYLFRRHEMGHLAYEMDEFSALVAEAETEIKHLMNAPVHRVHIELIRPWKSPRIYPEHEVPVYIPEPDIDKELQAFSLAPGLHINAYATDPMIANPIHLSWDLGGRAWVATSSTYPHIVPGREPNDKIVILEDVDHDGIADKHIVFADQLLVPQAVMPVEGGAFVCSTTEFLFLADTNGDDRADVRQVIFDGFGNADVHHMIHGLRWSPWGDLYFTQSIYINSFVETAHGLRQLNGTGIWQYQPDIQKLDIFSRGLINPWGHAFDQWGQAFATDGAGSSGINYVFPQSAHATAVGADRVIDGLNVGTPKNTAAEMIYSRHLPNSWQGSIITNDFRANRTIRYQTTSSGSGYLADEVETIAHSDHRSYRPVDAKMGPDGALYIVDWYNPIIDHGEVDFHHPVRDKSHGRIWRITNKNQDLLPIIDFRAASISQLLDYLKSPEQYTRLQANRALVALSPDPEVVRSWVRRLPIRDANYERHLLEALWLTQALDTIDIELLHQVLSARTAQVRAAGVRMMAHAGLQKKMWNNVHQLASDPDAQVRLEVVHALRTSGHELAPKAIMDMRNLPLDDNLDFATWFSIRATSEQWMGELEGQPDYFGADVNLLMYALLTVKDLTVLPKIESLLSEPSLTAIHAKKARQMLAKFGDSQTLQRMLTHAVHQEDLELIQSMVDAPESNKAKVSSPELLNLLLSHQSEQFRIAGIRLAQRWRLIGEIKAVETIAQQVSASSEERRAAMRALAHADQLDGIIRLARSDSDESLKADALVIWAEIEPKPAATATVSFLQTLHQLDLAEDLFQTYRASEEGPPALMQALADEQLPESVASLGLKVVQRSGMDLSRLEQVLRTAGNLSSVGHDLTETDRTTLIAEAKVSGDYGRGRNVYNRKELLCATCHRIKNIGGLIGPDLTTLGTYMTSAAILESILNPSSDIKQNYETVILTRTNGEVLSGTLHRKTGDATILRMANGELISIPQTEIDKVDVSPVSLMPAGLTASLNSDELKDLLHYLMNLGKENQS